MSLFRYGANAPHQNFSRGANRKKRRGFSARRSRKFELLEPRLVLASQPLITEFMASNDTTLEDGDGLSSDWIEIHNPTAAPVNLTDWHLTDNPDNLDKWTFPNAPQAVLEPGEYLIVFASNKGTETYIDPAGFLHTDFNLDADGEYLALTDSNNNIIHEYAPDFHRQVEDVSYGLLSNSSSVTLVGPSQTTTALVPTNGALDAPAAGIAPAWTTTAFDDSAWPSSGGGVGVGFDFGDDTLPNVPNGTLLPGGPIGFDLTDADENGTLDGTITAGGFPGSPANEEPPKALDNSEGTKWLAFLPSGTFYQFRFSGGQRHAVNGYTLTSANDTPNRDPYSWTLSGSNDGTNWTVVDTRNAQDFATRFETRLYEFSNNNSYEYYKFDFQTEFGVTGLNQPNSIQIAEIELLSTGPVDFAPLIDVDVEAAWSAAKTSVYQRIEFDVTDPSAFNSLMLEMQYEDGFVAYLNGKQVASRSAPTLPNFQSHATGERDDADALDGESINLTQHLGELVAGTNVLAIHVLNIDDESPDLLSNPRLVATQLVDDTVIEAYMPQPTPGLANSSEGVTPGPIIRDVTENPPPPLHNQNLVITAQVDAAAAPIASVTLHYRVMYAGEVMVAMNDSGTGSDLVAGDGLFTGVIPEGAYVAGQMVRWYVTASDTVGDQSRFPLFIKPTASAQYLGTVVQHSTTSGLPIFEYFVENVTASGTQTGTRGSVFFLGEFYDNVFVRYRGGNTTRGRKFEFNDGQHFLFDPNLPRVDEINLNERGADPTYMRQVMGWEVYAAAGVPASLGRPWFTRLNNANLDVRIFIEQPDADLLARTGLDPNGAFYKIGADGVENSVTSSTTGVRKRTRKNEDNSDLQALVNGVSPNNPNSETYAFDNIDIAGMINYIAATSIMHDNDHPHKNFHLYRDTEGTRQWSMMPWDKDLTFGLNFGISGIIGNQDPFGHPFFADQEHQKIDNQWNRMIDAVLDNPVIREMYVRRLRTLMDQFISPPGSAQPSWIETSVNELKPLLQPHITSGTWLTNVNLIVNEYLAERRQHLYVSHSINNPGFPDNAKIPNAQVGNPNIQFGQIEVNPASGNQNQEFVQLVNPNTTAVDISNWRIEGGIRHTFTPGTVIPAGGSMYISPSVPDFLARTTGPRGGQKLFVQGNYSGVLKDMGEEPLRLVAADGTFMAQVQQAVPGDYNEDLVVNTADYDMWRTNFGSTTIVNGDGNANGIVDAADYVLWRKNRSAGAAAAATSSVANVTADSTTTATSAVLAATDSPAAAQFGVGRQVFSMFTLENRGGDTTVASTRTRENPGAAGEDGHDIALLAVLDLGRAFAAAVTDDFVAEIHADSDESNAVESIDDLFAALTI